MEPGNNEAAGDKTARYKKTIVQEVFGELHEVRENRKVARLAALEIIIKVIRDASHSDKAYQVLEDYIDRYTPQGREPRHVLRVFEEKLT